MMRRQLARWLPSEASLRDSRSLRWLSPLLRRPWLWQPTRRRVAAGAAIGVFFGFAIPVLQIACAAAVAVLLRANLPVAAAATLVSNPFTYVPIYVLAYRTGAALLSAPVDPARAEATVAAPARDLRAWPALAMRVGKPLTLGLAVFAVVGAALAWFTVNLVWRIAVALRRRRGARGRGGAPPPA